MPQKRIFSKFIRIPATNVFHSNSKSKFIQTVPVEYVAISVKTITMVAGTQIYLSCMTSYCIPPANITWYKSSVDMTSLSGSIFAHSGGLMKTITSLQITLVKEDNGKHVFCKASNIRGKDESSSMIILNVLCKHWYLNEIHVCIFNRHFLVI